MLFYFKSFKDYNVILKVIVPNYVPVLLRTVKERVIHYFSTRRNWLLFASSESKILSITNCTNKGSEKVQFFSLNVFDQEKFNFKTLNFLWDNPVCWINVSEPGSEAYYLMMETS